MGACGLLFSGLRALKWPKVPRCSCMVWFMEFVGAWGLHCGGKELKGPGAIVSPHRSRSSVNNDAGRGCGTFSGQKVKVLQGMIL